MVKKFGKRAMSVADIGIPVLLVSLLAASAHAFTAGVINPPAANKHGHWVNSDLPASGEAWLDGATKRDGSWWPEWQAWLIANREDDRVPARTPGDAGLAIIEPAPGRYVRVRH